jgi:hypothetical protein
LLTGGTFRLGGLADHGFLTAERDVGTSEVPAGLHGFVTGRSGRGPTGVPAAKLHTHFAFYFRESHRGVDREQDYGDETGRDEELGVPGHSLLNS